MTIFGGALTLITLFKKLWQATHPPLHLCLCKNSTHDPRPPCLKNDGHTRGNKSLHCSLFSLKRQTPSNHNKMITQEHRAHGDRNDNNRVSFSGHTCRHSWSDDGKTKSLASLIPVLLFQQMVTHWDANAVTFSLSTLLPRKTVLHPPWSLLETHASEAANTVSLHEI